MIPGTHEQMFASQMMFVPTLEQSILVKWSIETSLMQGGSQCNEVVNRERVMQQSGQQSGGEYKWVSQCR